MRDALWTENGDTYSFDEYHREPAALQQRRPTQCGSPAPAISGAQVS